MNILLLEDTFHRISQENGGVYAFSTSFYDYLFSHHPALKPLFHTPGTLQAKRLMVSLALIVNNINRPVRLDPYLHAMGIRHASYGVKSEHYALISENFQTVLAEHLSKEGDWTPEMAQVWAEALSLVGRLMLEAAEDPDRYVAEMVSHGYLPERALSCQPSPQGFTQAG